MDSATQPPSKILLSRLEMIPLWMSTSFVIACNALVFGYDTGTIGPVTTMTSYINTFGNFSSSVHGVIVSAILPPGAIAALIAGILADRYGRTRMIAIGSTIFGIGTALEASSSKLAMFIVGRLIKGTGEGIFLSTVFVYVAEISPTRIRGIIGSLPQFMVTVGLVMGFFICYGTSHLQGSISWRLPLVIQAILAFSNATLCALVPPTPRWLLSQGRSEEARTLIAQLGLEESEQAELLSQSEAPLENSPEKSLLDDIRQTAFSFKEAFAVPFRSRTLFGVFLMAAQQLSGIDGVLYYAPILLQQAGIASQQASFLASGVSALIIFAVTIPATLLADRWGRKTSIVLGGVLDTALMVVMGSMYAAKLVHSNSGAGRWVVIVSIYLFAVVYSVTWAVSVRLFLVESQPRKTRSSAASLGQSSNWLANYIVALTTPVFIASTSFGAYYFFAGCTLVATIVSAIYIFETKGHSLEDIEKRYDQRQSVMKKLTGSWRFEVGSFRMRRIRGSPN